MNYNHRIVSISDYRGRIRLRWNYNEKRYSLTHGELNSENLKESRKTVLLIELDILNDQFDLTLEKYRPKLKEPSNTKRASNLIKDFELWVSVYKQMDCNTHSDYRHMRSTLKKWKVFESEDLLIKHNKAKYSAQTFNRHLSILNKFGAWMVKMGKWNINPFDGVSRRKVKRVEHPERQPFTEEEIKRILNAIKYDTYCSSGSTAKHSLYYPFIYFLFKTGVRNAEAVGLRVGSLDFENKRIIIKEVLARSVKGTNPAYRIRKETKNGKIRVLPMTEDLEPVLKPLIDKKGVDDLVFTSFNGLAIDDRMFQKRIFRKVLEELNIPFRVLYACRHTFGSRCIDQGITPVMTAFLMGNNPETALRNYTHQMSIPSELPNIL